MIPLAGDRVDRISDDMARDPYHHEWERFFAEEKALAAYAALDDALVDAYHAAYALRDTDDEGQQYENLCDAIVVLRGTKPAPPKGAQRKL